MSNNKKMLVLKTNNGNITIMQRKDMFCASLDTILLANFITIKPSTKKIIDFGTNNAVIPLILAPKFNGEIIGIEIEPAAAQLAQENVILNNLTARITIINEDIKLYAQQKNEKVDLIVCNPPFFPLLPKSKVKQQPLKIAARHEVHINLEQIIASAANLLKTKGRLVMVYNIERLTELLLLLAKYRFAPKKLQIVYPKINKNANGFLIEAGLEAQAGLLVLPPLICHNEDNSYITDIAKWYP